jgi:uncharacterized protein (UPF0332 family)
MTPEAARFLDKARQLLGEAETMLRVGLNEAAGRTAYLAAYHAAQALIFEHAGKVLKTHAGVQTEFLKLTRDDPRVDGVLRGFLSRAYNLKALADYETGPDTSLSADRAAAAIETGKRFVAHFAGLITGVGGPDQDAGA